MFFGKLRIEEMAKATGSGSAARVGEDNRKNDLLNGPLFKKIILFALPLALSSILQQCFNAADTAVIGRFASSDSMASVGATSIVINLIIGLFIGLSVGSNVVVASLIGRNDKARIPKAVHTSIMLALLSGILLLFVTFFIARPVLQLLSTPENIIDRSVLYLRIISVGLPFMMIYNFAASVLRSTGDSRRPFIALVIAGIVNVLLNLLFVIVFKMDVSGVAIATVISNGLSASILIAVLLREEEPFRLSLRKLRLNRDDLIWIFRIGAPAGLQGIVFSLSNMVIQTAINSFGSDAIAGTTAALNLDFVAYFIIVSFNHSATTFISQNYAAGQYDRCKKILRICLFTSLIVSQILCFIMYFTADSCLGIFTDNPQVIAYGKIRFAYAILYGSIPAFYEVTGSAMRGMGVSLLPAVLTIFGTCAFRVIWVLLVVPSHHTFEMVMIIYPLSWVLTGVLVMGAYLLLRKKLMPQEA